MRPTSQSRVTTKVTRADLDHMLDRVAAEIEARGPAGEALLPLYRRLEDEAARLELDEDTMASVRGVCTLSRKMLRSPGFATS